VALSLVVFAHAEGAQKGLWSQEQDSVSQTHASQAQCLKSQENLMCAHKWRNLDQAHLNEHEMPQR